MCGGKLSLIHLVFLCNLLFRSNSFRLSNCWCSGIMLLNMVKGGFNDMETAIHSVSELLTLLEKYHDQFGQSHRGNDFVFRGMSDKLWPLLPGVFRKYSEPQKSTTFPGESYSGRIYTSYETEMLARFKKEAGGILPNLSQGDDFVWLQYSQQQASYHEGTRLAWGQ